jgi:hypothetical protein
VILQPKTLGAKSHLALRVPERFGEEIEGALLRFSFEQLENGYE